MRLGHGNASNYYSATLAINFFSDDIKFRRLQAGTYQTWRTLGHDGNIPYAFRMNQDVRTTDSPTFAGLNLGNGNLNTVENIYLDNAIYSQGDTNTYMQFHSGDQWRVVTGGGERLEVNNSNTTLATNLVINSHAIDMDLNNINDNAISLREVRNSTWSFIFVTNGVGNDNSSGFWVGSNGYPDMRLRRDDGTVRALISSWERSYVSNGFSISGGTLDMNNNDIVGVDQIIHEGDTDTYMQFHASNEWRVVTGGSERLEVNNSNVTIAGNNLLLNGNYVTTRKHSGSDFTSGTLVQTDITSNTQNGASFVLEATGKSYSSDSPFDFIVQGYLYNNTIINHSGLHLGKSGFTTMKVFDNGGTLAFWWPRVSYWNSFAVHVRDAGGNDRNRVTSITNSTEPSSSKKVTVTMRVSPIYGVNQNVGDLYATNFYRQSTSVGAYNIFTYGGAVSGGNFQDWTNQAGEMNYIQVNNLASGFSNHPTGVYTYGGVISYRGANHSFQLYAAHTGDLAYKTQWNNDNYSGWRRILDSTNYPYAANMNQYVRTTDSVTFNEIYNNGWFRNNQSGEGLYNQATGAHWVSDADASWTARDSASSIRIRMKTNGSTERGSFYANSSNQIGILDAGGSWAVRHQNDYGTQFYTDGTTEEFRVGRDTVSGNYGTVETKTTKSGWGVYSINGRYVFMSDHSSTAGIYNDVDNEWMAIFRRNAEVELYHNGAMKFETRSDGVTISGNAYGSGTLDFDGKYHILGVSNNWDSVGQNAQTNLHFQGHQMFWIGAGNGTWFTGTANQKSQASGLASDANYAHDLLITTMYSDASYDRGITFAVSNNNDENSDEYSISDDLSFSNIFSKKLSEIRKASSYENFNYIRHD